MDELWSVVNHKNNKQWVWIAIDAKTREIVGLPVGDRSQTRANRCFASLMLAHRQFV